MDTLVFSIDDIREITNHVGLHQLMDETIEGITNICREYDDTNYVIPVRDGFEYREPDTGLIEWMPVFKTASQVVIKIVGYHPTNPDKRQAPTVLSTGLAFDVTTGHLSCVMDATFLTAIRTGAASAVASRILAAPEAGTLGLIGGGAQAVTQLHALSRIFDLREVMVYDVDPDTCQSFARRIAGIGLGSIRVTYPSLENIISAADILCTSTSVEIGKGPVFQDLNPQPGIHINSIGSDFPGKTELPCSLLKRSLVCPDFRLQALKEGECQQLNEDEVGPDLVELVQKSDIYAEYQHRMTVFDSTGWALEDYVIINIIANHGRKLNRGRLVKFASICDDPKSPYGFLDLLPEKKSVTNDHYTDPDKRAEG